jgi:hypothetical protein
MYETACAAWVNWVNTTNIIPSEGVLILDKSKEKYFSELDSDPIEINLKGFNLDETATVTLSDYDETLINPTYELVPVNSFSTNIVIKVNNLGIIGNSNLTYSIA